MDLVETGVIAFVAFVFIGGSMAYFAGPPELDALRPQTPVEGDPCADSDACGETREVERKDEDDDKDDDKGDDEDDDDDDREGRGEKGKKRGKD